MIKFFRKIRQKLLSENKLSKYLLYAIGEIVLIMLGIFMALQLQNWNDNREKNNAFNSALQLLYNSLKADSEFYYSQYKRSEFNVNRSDILLNDLESFEKEYLPFHLYGIQYLDQPYNSESEFYIDDLESNAHTKEQKLITKEVLKFIALLKTKSAFTAEPLKKLVRDYKISSPKTTIEGWAIDSTYHNTKELNRIYKTIQNEDFQFALKTVRSSAYSHQLFSKNKHTDAESVRALIKTYYPEVRIVYTDIGVIGTSINGFEGEGVKSTPMLLTNADESIWEIKLFLKAGEVKFRARDSWAENWGAIAKDIGKLEGKGIQDGRNIVIAEAGNYHIVLNLTTNKYQFIRLDN